MKKEFWFASNVEHSNFASMDLAPKNILYFSCDFSKKKEYNLHKFPSTWATPLMCFHLNTDALGPILVNPTMKEVEECFVWGFLRVETCGLCHHPMTYNWFHISICHLAIRLLDLSLGLYTRKFNGIMNLSFMSNFPNFQKIIVVGQRCIAKENSKLVQCTPNYMN